MEAMRVGLIAPPWVPVPPPEYGGTELVLAELAVGLQRAGMEVVLFATGDSTCPVPLRWHHRHALGTEYRPGPELSHIDAAYRALDDVDVVHDHTLLGPHWAKKHHVRTPIVTTVHSQFMPRLAAHYRRLAEEGVTIVGISHHQASGAPPGVVSEVIHHGIDPNRYPLGPGDGGYVLFLGRICEDKGPHLAIEAARRAAVPIRLAAKMRDPDERRFFAESVKPLLGPDAVYLGEVGFAEKVELLRGAVALVNPIRWDEPFGLVMIESLSCGTPVLTFPRGAAPEIVDDGVTGALCEDLDGLSRAIEEANRLDRSACRAAAVERFSTQRMVRDHRRLYHRAITAPHGDPVNPSRSRRRQPPDAASTYDTNPFTVPRAG